MLRWLLRALTFLTVASVLTMHGASADGVTHEVAATTAAGQAMGHATADHTGDSAPSGHDHRSHVHHLAMACVAVLATVTAIVARRRGAAAIPPPPAPAARSFARARRAVPAWRPPPAWLELGVTLR